MSEYYKYHRVFAREMARLKQPKLLHGKIGNIIPVDVEWSKWLDYEPLFEKRRIEELENKIGSELSIEELQEIIRYRKNKMFANLFKKYKTNNCTEEEYMMVYDFMCEEKIDDLILSKLTKSEQQYAKCEAAKYFNIENDELYNILNKNKYLENYQEIEMIDAYILHLILDKFYEKSFTKKKYIQKY